MVIIKPVIHRPVLHSGGLTSSGCFPFLNKSPWLVVCFSYGFFGFFHGLDSHSPRSEGCHQINTLDMDGYSPLHLALLSPPTEDQPPGRMGTAGRQKGKDIYIYIIIYIILYILYSNILNNWKIISKIVSALNSPGE